MKIIAPVLLAFLFLFLTPVFSQAPELINYQAVLRDAGGQILNNTSTSIKIQMREASSAGSVVYSEEHGVTTSSLGMVNFAIGQGSNQTGTLSAIKLGYI